MLFLAVAAGAVLLVFDVPIPFGGFRDDIERQLSAALGREVTIDGKIILVSGATPSLRVEKMTLGNPPDWQGGERFAYCERFETAIGLAELLNEEINVDDITIHGLQLTLEEDAEGRNNWESLTGSGKDESELQAEPNDETAGLDLDFTGLDFITVTELAVTHKVAGQVVESIFSINSLMGSALEGDPVQLAVTGRIKSLPFDGNFKGGTLSALLAGASEWPFELDADLHGATLVTKGKMSAANFSRPGSLDFTLDIPDLQKLTPVTGPLPFAGGLQLSGEVLRESTARYFRLPELKGELAGVPVTGSVELDFRAEIPRLGGEIAIGVLELAPLGAMARESLDDLAESEEPASEPGPDESPWGSRLPLVGTFTIRVDEITGLPTSLRDLNMNLELSETAASAEVEVEFADAPFSGQLQLERKIPGGKLDLALDLDGNDADLSELIRFYTGDDRFSGKFESLRLEIRGRGASPMDSWERRKVDARLKNAGMTYQGGGKAWKFFLESGIAHREFGGPGEMRISGTMGDAAYEMRAAFHIPKDSVISHFDEIAGKVADAEFEIGDVTVEGSPNPYELLEFKVKGGRLDKLDSIYELDLPPFGPYTASGVYRREANVVSVENMDLQIGGNQLLGKWRLDAAAKPRKLTGTLNAATIQIGEFSGSGWSPIVKSLQTGDAEEAVEGTRRKLLSREILSSLDAEVQLEVGEVLSGSDRLGKGELKLTLDQARLRIEPLALDIPGGHFDGSFLFHPKEDGTLDWKIRLAAKKADYSNLARRINAKSKAAGVLNLDLDLGATGVPFGAFQMNVASGRLAFNVCPKNIDASGLDIWAIGLVQALLHELDPNNESTLNCVLGKLHLDDGIIIPESLGLDTSTIRVVADGQIDLKSDTIDLKLTPYPKKPQLLSIEAPVSIQGPLEDPEIGMGDLAIVLFPLKAVASERLPEDGSDICACAANYSPDPDREDSLVLGVDDKADKEDKKEKSGDDEPDRKE